MEFLIFGIVLMVLITVSVSTAIFRKKGKTKKNFFISFIGIAVELIVSLLVIYFVISII